MWQWASAVVVASAAALAPLPPTLVLGEELTVPPTKTPEDLARYLVREGCPEVWTTKKIEQQFWPTHVVFRLSCPTGGFARVPDRTIAVSSSRDAIEITENVFDRADRRGLGNFNAISRDEHVAIDRDTAQEYFEFFLDAYLENPGIFLPSDRIAAVIRQVPFGSEESKLLVRSFGYENHPVVRIDAKGRARFRGTTIQWLWWCRGMEQINLVTDRNGQLQFSTETFGEQVPQGDDEAD